MVPLDLRPWDGYAVLGRDDLLTRLRGLLPDDLPGVGDVTPADVRARAEPRIVGMFPPGLMADDQLARLEAALGLEHHGEDWGIVNADGARVVEFIDFFVQSYDRRWKTPVLAEYLDLVLESACDAVREGRQFPAEPLGRFMSTVGPVVTPDRVAYWTAPNRAVAPHFRRLGY